jgi:hypothetical protein
MVTKNLLTDPERVSENLAPLKGVEVCFLLSGGWRCATTIGYYWQPFRLSQSPSNVRNADDAGLYVLSHIA